ncbi:hypothetical protein PHYBLDRAFT_153465 [Phycomyces blakesleeanus NRRL 1555(-)]|uniref:Uncharacterized protein n=1 Tax=Phycomyces blakesleeanus (strain ATCC 8743b / DSM 1359 / FGSC 10004 / NBRC 33097 / NRRL 1555) TaxID=763407 RepID=A0A167J7I2_PHYB8|nr:hypothetical protein PHYBLDRAFT_153465 [Phycomyces blakesleeanus NRRL 1555(-)]OAD65379.1 hypothetical protein PHYBLDRAFT_153465 [Phycomyces blakesleeanus NRRL 1555(-)]|eukprot:XP_018283419.1 hypothetical protein PHYBLDRAFT_153465 [Phycomyces blakesleeanus NRRL 1555(-)]
MVYQRQSLSQTTTLLEIFFCLPSDTSNPNDAGEPYRYSPIISQIVKYMSEVQDSSKIPIPQTMHNL